MSRLLVCALGGLLLCGCLDCEDQGVYDCALRYDPYYGYYQDCYVVANQCRHDKQKRCKGFDCEDACTTDADCASGKVCSFADRCVDRTSRMDAGASGGGTTADSGSPGAMPGDAGMSGGTRPDAGAASAVDAGVVGAGGAGAGPAASSGGATGEGGTGTTSGGGNSPSGTGGVAGSPGGQTGGTSSATGEGGRIARLNFSCVRDTQCGAGQCTAGLCYTACESDADCGTGDRCSVETGRRLCMPDPNPPVRCDESAICTPRQTCVNGACHDPCDVDTDCDNLEDRCVSHLCFPDRRPIAECVLNIECPADLVCLDGRCVVFGGD